MIPDPSIPEANFGTRQDDSDIPPGVRSHLMRAAVANGRINYYWLCAIYRAGAEQDEAAYETDLAALRQERDELKVGYERAVYGLKVAAADFRRCAKGLHHAQAMASFADSAEQAISEASILAALAQEK